MPWKNGQGATREIAVHPEGASLDNFMWRVSLAQVNAPGPFSLFRDCDRILCVVRGGPLYLSLTSVVLNELVRGVLAPFGHGLWAAILGGVIFHASRKGHLRLTWSVLVAYIGVSILHAAFDLFGGITGYIVISIIGIVPLVYLWVWGDRGISVRPVAQPAQIPG